MGITVDQLGLQRTVHEPGEYKVVARVSDATRVVVWRDGRALGYVTSQVPSRLVWWNWCQVAAASLFALETDGADPEIAFEAYGGGL